MKLKHFIYVFFYVLISACANIISPSGGPIDKEAPKLAEQSNKDSSLNFKGGKLEFEFNEKIDDTKIKVETFPLMKSVPKILVDKRTLTLNIPDSLLEDNTTYKISFGNTIKDIYEGNSLGKLDFTFSTGNVIDSLQLSGIVLQANSGLPDTQAHVLLYSKIESDSDVQYKRPLYAVKVDQFGMFKLGNLPEKEFYIYAVADKNFNYVYDLLGERIAFINTTIIPVKTQDASIKLLSFAETKDTSKTSTSSASRNKTLTGASSNQRFKINIDTLDTKKRTFDVTQPILLSFGNILTAYDKSKIRLYINSILDETGIVNYDSSKKVLTLNVDLMQDTIYTLQLLEGFAKDTALLKSASLSFRTKNILDYGTLLVSIPPANDNFNGQRILYLKQNNILVSEKIIKDSLVTFTMLNAGNYTLSMLHDDNNNKEWDTGKFKSEKRQPERVEAFNKEILVQANWINKINWLDMSSPLDSNKIDSKQKKSTKREEEATPKN